MNVGSVFIAAALVVLLLTVLDVLAMSLTAAIVVALVLGLIGALLR